MNSLHSVSLALCDKYNWHDLSIPTTAAAVAPSAPSVINAPQGTLLTTEGPEGYQFVEMESGL